MASTNPYSIADDGSKVTGNGTTVTVADVNDELPDGVSVERLTEGCDCDVDKYTHTKRIVRGDKWGLKMCNHCGGVWGWHDARADYL